MGAPGKHNLVCFARRCLAVRSAAVVTIMGKVDCQMLSRSKDWHRYYQLKFAYWVSRVDDRREATCSRARNVDGGRVSPQQAFERRERVGDSPA
jgi:hypothetical protein